VHEHAVEDGVDVLRTPENVLELRAAASCPNDGEIAGPCVAQSLAVEDERHAGHEVRLADDELAALLDLDDCAVAQVSLPALLPTFWFARTKRCKDAASCA
jgi:hypothetical protein